MEKKLKVIVFVFNGVNENKIDLIVRQMDLRSTTPRLVFPHQQKTTGNEDVTSGVQG